MGVAIHYTEQQAAIHESGHTAVALALGLDIDHLELALVPGGAQGWRGHCVLVGDGPVNARFAAMDAFCLAGPLCQLLLEPNSLDGHADVFHPSLFSEIQSHFADKGSLINQLRWQGDLIDSRIIYLAPDAPGRELAALRYGEKPWLIGLEPILRQLFLAGEVKAFLGDLVSELTAAPDKRLLPAKLAEIYNAN